ncbi:hypothetical protein PN36_33295, partial [Candidatus Thiomargarita nelsonii]
TYHSAGVSEHIVYVTLAEKLEYLDKMYLTLLHLATGNPGATTKAEAVEKTWSWFANPTGVDDLKTWDNRALSYYGSGINECYVYVDDFLKAQNGSAGCGTFANLFIETLWVNGISSRCVNVSPPSENGEGILINNWEPPLDENPEAPIEEPWYIWEFEFTGEMSMYPQPEENESGYLEYGDLESSDGIAGQNVVTPIEKAFTKHFIVEISDPDVTANLSYYDPSYGKTYVNEEKFDIDLVLGYFFSDDEDRLWVRPREEGPQEKNILFKSSRDQYPLCGTDPLL